MLDQRALVTNWQSTCEAAAADAVKDGKTDYKRYHANHASAHVPLIGKTVLVVGCARGEDCRLFTDMGAARVIGLDVMDEIGVNFPDERVTYVKASAENMPLENGIADLVFSYATLEHVPDIFRAFKELGRTCRHGGYIYSAASPLWNSRPGPHWGTAFNDFPWIHLRKSVDEIFAYNEERHQRDHKAPHFNIHEIRYFMHNDPFNKRPARDYIAAVGAVRGIGIIRNDIEIEADDGVDPVIVEELGRAGFDRLELFGLTHMFIARKI